MGAQSTLNTGRDLPVEIIEMIFKEVYHRPPGENEIKTNEDPSTTTNMDGEAIDDLEATTWEDDTADDTDDNTDDATDDATEDATEDATKDDTDDDTEGTWPTVKRDLAACTLVCRQYHKIATPLLFRDLHFRFSPTSTPRDITSVIKFLKTHQLVRESIRSLVLIGHPKVERTDAQELLRLLHMLPRLGSLKLNEIPIVFSEAPPLTVCPALDNLQIRFTGDYSQGDFFRVMHCFGEIGKLTITFWGGVDPFYNDEGIPYYNDVALQIRPKCIVFEFKLSTEIPMDLRGNLLKHPEVTNVVTRLQLDHWDTVLCLRGAHEEGQIFLNYFKTVTHLEIGLSDEDSVAYNPEVILTMDVNLSLFTVLTTLQINHTLGFYDSITCRDLLDELAMCIRYITPGPALRTLRLCLTPVCDPKSKPVLDEILKEMMERVCKALEDTDLADALDEFAAFTNQCGISVHMMLPSMATIAQETVAVSLLRTIFSKRSKKSMEYLVLGVMKGDELSLIDEHETGGW